MAQLSNAHHSTAHHSTAHHSTVRATAHHGTYTQYTTPSPTRDSLTSPTIRPSLSLLVFVLPDIPSLASLVVPVGPVLRHQLGPVRRPPSARRAIALSWPSCLSPTFLFLFVFLPWIPLRRSVPWLTGPRRPPTAPGRPATSTEYVPDNSTSQGGQAQVAAMYTVRYLSRRGACAQPSRLARMVSCRRPHGPSLPR